ncbi:hypothetical protein Tco_0978403 [Tanacetum coccineum]|uniref:Integrase, catalytic region, zinc finger, CCHC-type, peptidase aspartic, catalytic n=1 Tax=Tanacetum coccineum TaxID=301880 RepID=A0ABQ5EMV0_9ASTR
MLGQDDFHNGDHVFYDTLTLKEMFTSRDGESMESYYLRFYKLMNELTRNNLQVTTMQVNVQFLQQLQPEWSRFVTVVKQSKEIDTISYHTLFDILKQYQNEVNDIRAERIAKSVTLASRASDWLEEPDEEIVDGIESTLQFHGKRFRGLPEESSFYDSHWNSSGYIKSNVSDGSSKQVTQQNLPQNRKQAKIHTNTLTPGMYRIATSTTQNREPQLPHASRNTNPHVSTFRGVNHSTSVSRPSLKSYQVKDKVVPNNSQVKFTKKEVEDHYRISSISKKTKSVTAYNDSLNSRTSNVNVVCAECGKCVFNSNHDACVSKYLNDVNARTKKPKVVPISASKPKRKMNKSVATPHKKTVASDTTIQKPKSYFKELYKNTNKAWKWWIEKKCPSEYKWNSNGTPLD